ncbi:MAG: hypothetical protein JSV04_10285 [Candidatus Heimdallarchaeota archaeon]|nr:MAG: hypothetical protein JSV04_10285 [Candidatus Heimdallarchaeota archaeon]
MRKNLMKFFFFPLVVLGLTFLVPVIAEISSESEITGNFPEKPWMTAGNGERINITAGNRTQIRTTAGNHIQIQTNKNAQLQINESETNPAGELPNQTRAVNCFMHIELNGTVAMNATMFRNYTNAEISELGNVSTFRWAFYNTSAFQWQYTHQNWVEKTENGSSVCCNTTHFSIWTILMPSTEESSDGNPTPGTPFNAKNKTGFAVKAGNLYQIQTQTGFAIQLKLNQSSEMTITEYEEPLHAMNQQHHQIRTQIMALELNNSAQIQANLSYTFTKQVRTQLGVQNMEKLKFMFYNESSNSWEAPKSQWLDNETLYCNTTHFSLWTIAEDVGETTTTTEDTEETTTSPTPGFVFLSLISILIPVLLSRSRKRR